jgi:hypothetical protein
VDVAFPDLRSFVLLGNACVQRLFHRCGDDDYCGRLFILNSTNLVEMWQVRGPRKNYRSIAYYRRA